ncbi:MAG: ion transporter [Chloroflexota bacterium]
MVKVAREINSNRWFHDLIIGVIILAGVIAGLDTYESISQEYGTVLTTIDILIVIVFVIELVIKFMGEADHPLHFFQDGWNIFDFIIVALSVFGYVFPVDTSFLPVLRLARVFRLFMLAEAIPQLRFLVETLLHSLKSIGYVSIFLALLFYVFGVMSVIFFGANDPIHFSSLHLALLTLFRVSTLEDWTDVMYINMYGCDNYGYGGSEALCTDPSAAPIGAAIFFSLFVILATMIVLNLFVGVILDSMDRVKEDREIKELAAKRIADEITIEDEMHMIHTDLDDIANLLKIIKQRMPHERPHDKKKARQ